MRKWGWWTALAILIVGVVGALHWPSPRMPAAQPSEPRCVDYVDGGRAGAILDFQNDTGSRPPGFDAVAVILCEPSSAVTFGEDITEVRMTTWTGDVANVQAAFDRRSPKVRFDGFFFCSGDYPVPVGAVWLVDGAGLGYRPSMPVTRCSRTDFTPLDTIDSLEVVDIVDLSLPLTE